MLSPTIPAILPPSRGGTGLSSYSTGDLIYANVVDSLARLAIGTANTVMTSSGTAPQWSTSLALSGTISSSNIAGTISGNGTIATGGFTLTVSATASISGTNTGDLTLAAIGSTPNANGASLSGQALTLQPADGTYGGIVTTGTQTIAGAKTFSSSIEISGGVSGLIYSMTLTNATLNGFAHYASNASTDQKYWAWQNGSAAGDGLLRLRALNDAGTNGKNALVFTRTGFSTLALDIGCVTTVSDTTASTSTTTGSLINAGGFGCAGAIYGGSNIFAANAVGIGTTSISTATGTGLMISGAYADMRFNWTNSANTGFFDFSESGTQKAYFQYRGSTNSGGEKLQIVVNGALPIEFSNNGTTSAKIDADTTSGNTRFMIYDVDNATLERVTVGAADSGGSGYKVLRIPN